MRFGLCITLLAILFGFGMGGLFGGFEDLLKNDLKSRAHAVLDSVYKGDQTKLQATIDKAWVYYQRSHLHGAAIGTASLACILALAFMHRPASRTKAVVALALGVGALGYALYWLWAGYRAPELGGTAAAKESLKWLALPTSGAALLGILSMLILSLWEWMFTPAPSQATPD